MNRHSIAVVAFDRISPFHLAVPCIVFGEERGGIGVPSFDFRVCAAEPHALATSAGFTIAARHSLDALAAADVDHRAVVARSRRNAAGGAARRASRGARTRRA